MQDSQRKVVVLGVDGLIPELLERFCDEGVLPNIRRLLDEGGATRLMPWISTWGDTNFVTMLTGQAPGTSWIGQRMPPVGTRHLLELMSEQGYRSALVHFPESLQPSGAQDFCLAPFWSGAGPAPMEMAAAALHTTDDLPVTAQPSESLGWPPAGATLAHHQKHNRRAIEVHDEGFTATLQLNDGTTRSLRMQADDERLTLHCHDRPITLSSGEWSEWLPIGDDEYSGRVRFKLLAFDPIHHHVELLQSQITVPAEHSSQPELARVLIDRHGPFISKWTVTASPDERWFETSFEEGRYQLDWLTNAAMTLLNEHDFNLFATVFRLNDETHHTCLAQCDPASPFYRPEQRERYLDVIRRAYRVLDEGVGRLLQQRRDDTLIVLASDHGDVPNRYLCDIYRRLATFDLCTLDDYGQPIRHQSRALLKDERGGLEIFVNLAGRDPEGVVAPADFDQVQTRILRALTSWYCVTPDGEQNVIAVALKKCDAQVLGYWGEHAGDVLFAYSPGFVWGTNQHGDTLAPVQSPGANHGPQIPSARTDFASNHGLAVLHGPGVRTDERSGLAISEGLPRMSDLGATLAHWLGLAERGSLDGRVLTALLKS
ncbi:type I phosphodiesterase/nucleotide pyrophosphatase [Kushneria sinocarnis]|uniref:Type I phosphodiesterase/nucleotide pyrophosphatase n=1 Tax=Kushneria sinocarnis TaxID=595502 RepID=A0A420X147_9GAMM|nr:alkaline phosphatase family protein [Kushneria sinocarnis]RKR07467.1 type I phosphodiesterase/nucleotide pyrophosphatase [Kushneria sinocarnis]